MGVVKNIFPYFVSFMQYIRRKYHQIRTIIKHTYSNPADDASIGVPANGLERWLHGPNLLAQSTEMWPKQPKDLCNLPDDQPELKKSNVCAAANTVNPPPDVEYMYEEYRDEEDNSMGASLYNQSQELGPKTQVR